MRISDWSSDVCSSDLRHRLRDGDAGHADVHSRDAGLFPGALTHLRDHCPAARRLHAVPSRILDGPCGRALPLAGSEEHTSELQSLMRISYAVFCLKKKKKPKLKTLN